MSKIETKSGVVESDLAALDSLSLPDLAKLMLDNEAWFLELPPPVRNGLEKIAGIPKEERRRVPAYWEVVTGIRVLNADGWRVDGLDFETPLTQAQYEERASHSTCEHRTGPFEVRP